jgi:hypothetical protein
MSTWALLILGFDYPVEWDYMSYLAREYPNGKSQAYDYEPKAPASVEEEIANMEKNRRDLIRKLGGEKYDKDLERLIRRKQKKYRSYNE